MAQINKPDEYFNTVLYTGTGSELAITGVGFQPDWTWIKRRDAVANGGMFDNVRGATKLLSSSQTDAEQTLAQSLKSFDSDGFTLGTGTNGYVNTNGSTTVAWNWLASNTTASNTDGSITSTVSASTVSGFSIVSWTGSGANGTVGHGLGVAPSLIITKSLASTQEWCVGSDALGWGNYLFLNETSASQSGSTYWQSTAPTNQVFSVGTAGPTNSSSGDLIAYCFAEKKGFSKFGSYTGNGSTDGTFVYTGFKPAFVIIKVSSTTNDWSMYDNQRDPINQVDNYLQPNTSNAEVSDTGKGTDFLSNGFKLRTTHGTHNTSGATYIYMAFAESPLVGTNNIPAVAR
jgi:hypothetical protein